MSLPENIYQALRGPILKEAEQVFYDLDKVATGKTVKSLALGFKAGNTSLAMTLEAEGGALYIDSGRKAGSTMPPIAPIKEWMEARGISANPFVIARSIAEKGIKPTPLVETLDERLDTVIRENLSIDIIQAFINTLLIG